MWCKLYVNNVQSKRLRTGSSKHIIHLCKCDANVLASLHQRYPLLWQPVKVPVPVPGPSLAHLAIQTCARCWVSSIAPFALRCHLPHRRRRYSAECWGSSHLLSSSAAVQGQQLKGWQHIKLVLNHLQLMS